MKCELCNIWFSRRQTLKDHMKSKHTSKDATVVKISRSDEKHIDEEDPEGKSGADEPVIVRRECDFCDEYFLNINEHRRRQHPDSWRVEKARRKWLSENKIDQASGYKIRCHLCEETRSTTDEIRAHWHEAHPGQTDIPKGNGREVLGDGFSICPICGIKLKTRGMNFHINKWHPESYQAEFKCDICGQGLRSKASLKHHVTWFHTPGGRDQINLKKSVCQICGKSVGKLEPHMKLHEGDAKGERPKECTYCGKQFPTFHKMTCHRRLVHRAEWEKDKERLLVQEGSRVLPGSVRAEYKKNYDKKQKEKRMSMKSVL